MRTFPSYTNTIKSGELKVQIRENAFVTIFVQLSIWKQIAFALAIETTKQELKSSGESEYCIRKQLGCCSTFHAILHTSCLNYNDLGSLRNLTPIHAKLGWRLDQVKFETEPQQKCDDVQVSVIASSDSNPLTISLIKSSTSSLRHSLNHTNPQAPSTPYFAGPSEIQAVVIVM